MLTRGADSAVLPLGGNAEERKSLASRVDALSLEGLRVLVLGGKRLSRTEWDMMAGRPEIGESEICVDLELLGCVGLRDGLQPETRETLEMMRRAKIPVCMVTGDKKETAVGVALSCGLIARNAAIVATSATGEFRLLGASEEKDWEDVALVIEGGEQLGRLLKDERTLCALLTGRKATVICRATPGEKARVVEVMQRLGGQRVLAIGDGANDVSMLHTANVGVGIAGALEGSQAANAADYTIGRFSDLRPLLFVHGSSFSKRFATFNKLFLFKNFILTLCQLFFFKTSAFSGQTLFDDWYLLGFNSVFCLLPLVIATCNTQPIPTYRACEAAEYVAVRNSGFTGKSMCMWFLRGVATAATVFFCTAKCTETVVRADGTTNDFAFFSLLLYTQLILLVSILTFTSHLDQAKFSWKFALILLVYNIGMYALFVFTYDQIIWTSEKWRLKQVALTLFADPNFWLVSFLVLSGLSLAEHAHRAFHRPYLTKNPI